MEKSSRVLGGIFGVAVGDALGVPFEFTPRQIISKSPVCNMVGFGEHNQPKGTWSDDTSLTLCLAESLADGFNMDDIADRFCMWLDEAYMTATGVVFDCGNTTFKAIKKLKSGISPEQAGDNDELSNGNGALMRIIPMAFYTENMSEEDKYSLLHRVASITHRHPRNKIACGIYNNIAINLIKGMTPMDAYLNGVDSAVSYYEKKDEYKDELAHYKNVYSGKIYELNKSKLSGDGYVVHTLETSLWCFLNNDSYKKSVLTAVNFGDDTDTTASVTGGLAGLYYGYEGIPIEWLNNITRKDDIMKIAGRLYSKVYDN